MNKKNTCAIETHLWFKKDLFGFIVIKFSPCFYCEAGRITVVTLYEIRRHIGQFSFQSFFV